MGLGWVCLRDLSDHLNIFVLEEDVCAVSGADTNGFKKNARPGKHRTAEVVD